ncbi:uncharacterized protein LOC103697096 [Phoenix dactylifera]|uniref:Uncharacterized protein LOC103697096 n=1 Tax=Phoenix dactylifera TaxID=42345 RepID=A0A8B7BI61_PHODC|nr:uncharacterized protein LOC103697096 [Phoenix dactylifera]
MNESAESNLTDLQLKPLEFVGGVEATSTLKSASTSRAKIFHVTTHKSQAPRQLGKKPRSKVEVSGIFATFAGTLVVHVTPSSWPKLEVTWPRDSRPFCLRPLLLPLYKSRHLQTPSTQLDPRSRDLKTASLIPPLSFVLAALFAIVYSFCALKGSRMAASATLHSYMGGLMPRVGSRSGSTGLRSTYLLPRQHPMRIRCQAEDQRQPAQIPTSKPKAKESTKFSDVLAFSGPAPERINGRLAMVGFVSALAVELVRGDDLAAQLMNGGLPWFAATAVLWSVASLVPLFKGVSVQSKSDGLMTADAELWNGRFAMMGLVALAFTEYLKGGPLV